MMKGIDDIHQFWFQGINDQTLIKNNQLPFKRWFMKDDALDQQIKISFEADLLNAVDVKYKDWEETLKGRLALILLFDQFSRNIYRASARMFAFDERASALALKTIKEARDKDLMLIERVFLYMPLQHSEDIRLQERSVTNFQSLIDESQFINPANTPYYKYTFDYARRHYEVIKRFGRFPHRNDILKRDSSPEELAFLQQPGARF